MVNLPLIKGFLANTYWKAFVLGAFLQAFTASAAVEIRRALEDRKKVGQLSGGSKAGMTMVVSFLLSMLAFGIMYVGVGFGGGMLTTDNPFQKQKLGSCACSLS